MLCQISLIMLNQTRLARISFAMILQRQIGGCADRLNDNAPFSTESLTSWDAHVVHRSLMDSNSHSPSMARSPYSQDCQVRPATCTWSAHQSCAAVIPSDFVIITASRAAIVSAGDGLPIDDPDFRSARDPGPGDATFKIAHPVFNCHQII